MALEHTKKRNIKRAQNVLVIYEGYEDRFNALQYRMQEYHASSVAISFTHQHSEEAKSR